MVSFYDPDWSDTSGRAFTLSRMTLNLETQLVYPSNHTPRRLCKVSVLPRVARFFHSLVPLVFSELLQWPCQMLISSILLGSVRGLVFVAGKQWLLPTKKQWSQQIKQSLVKVPMWNLLNSLVQLVSANSGRHYQMIKLRDEKGHQSITLEATGTFYSIMEVVTAFPAWFAI